MFLIRDRHWILIWTPCDPQSPVEITELPVINYNMLQRDQDNLHRLNNKQTAELKTLASH